MGGKQDAEFAARLERIAAGGAHTRNTLFVGVDEAYVLPTKKCKAKETRLEASLAFLYIPLTILLALFIGICAMVLVKVVHFHAFANAPIWDSAVTTTAINTMLAVLLSIIAGRLVFRDQAASLLSWQVIGVVFAATGAHNLVHQAPNLFALLFSENWVRQVLISTEFRTLIVGNMTLPF
jgi:hypothetical protein